MTNLLAARSQMALSLGFHIVFACIGMVMPFLMVMAYHRYLRTRDAAYWTLTHAWLKGTAIFFAVGAVSGTVLSFELGLLWPNFMTWAGPIIGMPFSLEGAAFFTEAIFIGIFLYGRRHIPEWLHWWCGVVVGVSGVVSGIFVVAANAWMNSPSGFTLLNGTVTNIDPIAALFNPAWLSQALHMTIAAFEAVGFGVAGLHAIYLLRNPNNALHQKAFRIAASVAIIAAILQPLSGDFSARDVAKRQPIKLAAMEAHFHTEAYAPLIIGGWPDTETQTVKGAIEIPGGLSFLIYRDSSKPIIGLAAFPRDQWPSVPVVHIAFQVMVAIGMALMVLAVLTLFFWLRRRPLPRWAMMLWALSAPLGIIAVEAGWTVTELGRQPWIIYGIMRTADAVTALPGLLFQLGVFTAIYVSLAVVVTWLMLRQMRAFERVSETS
ncbi:MAG: cytochrome ubiquinol oxidase subunit I [Candidatus Margulisiibacteriota bacterium]